MSFSDFIPTLYLYEIILLGICMQRNLVEKKENNFCINSSQLETKDLAIKPFLDSGALLTHLGNVFIENGPAVADTSYGFKTIRN